MARYMAEEFLAASHEVVILSRRSKPWFADLPKLIVRTSDYSLQSLTEGISDCEGLVSAILDYSLKSVDVHLTLLEACKASPKCKRYVPSEYAGNTDKFPDQPTFYFANHEPVREALRAQKDVMWTLFNCGWLSDYVILEEKRYIKDIGDFHPINFPAGTFKIPGDGKDRISFTAARDVAKGLASLFASKEAWEEIIYVQGELSSWNEVADFMEKKGIKLQRSWESREDMDKQIAAGQPGEDSVVAAQYAMWSISGAGELPQEKVKRQAEKYFPGVHFRSVAEFMKDAESVHAP